MFVANDAEAQAISGSDILISGIFSLLRLIIIARRMSTRGLEKQTGTQRRGWRGKRSLLRLMPPDESADSLPERRSHARMDS